MSYIVIKTVRGRRYRYLQTSWREGNRVRTKAICVGPVDGGGRGAPRRKTGGLMAFIEAQRLSPEDRALASAERHAREIEEYQREHFGETAAERSAREREEHLGKLHAAYGLKLSDAKPSPAAPPAPAAAPSGAAADSDNSNAQEATATDTGETSE